MDFFRTGVYPCAVAFGMGFVITLAYGLRVLHYVECFFMIIALEVNAILIPRLQRRAKESKEHNSSYVACCIGYQETEENFTACVRSYKTHAAQCKAYLIALDGSVEENSVMVKVFKQEFGENGGEVICYERPLGDMCETLIESFRANPKDDTQTANSYAFDHIYNYVREQISLRVQEIQSKTSKNDALPAIIISQPHVGLKAIRFAAFMTSMVLADLLQVGFMWSSDSDSRITADCVENMVDALIGDDLAGAGSATLSASDQETSLFNRVYGGHYQNEDRLRWSAGGCVGKCGNCQGPACCYRVEAIKGAVIEWYMQRIAGERVWINEDIHMNTLLIREGWSTFYVQNALVESAAPPTLNSWLKQAIRWDRSPHQERLGSPWATFNPANGFVKLFSHLRELMLMPFLFLYITNFAFTRKAFPASYPLLGPGLMLSFFVQRFWSVARFSKPRGNFVGCVLAALLYFVAYPFTHVWSLLTFFEDNWETTTKKRSTVRFAYVSFAMWLGLCGLAAARAMQLI